ncbi:MAG: hypothetical protein CMO81_07015 [Waddliaceae bacterium]|nr:hypothetical protein [Waddliaceae bacterium]
MSRDNSGKSTLAFIMFCQLMCGLATTLNTALIPCLKELLQISLAKALQIQIAFYLGYSAAPFAGKLLKALQYRKSLFIALIGTSVGCLIVYPAAGFANFSLFLFAVFVLGANISLLQVSTSSLTLDIGDPKYSSSRIVLVMSFYAMGTAIGPMLGAAVFLGSNEALATIYNPSILQTPYTILALSWLLLAGLSYKISLPHFKTENKKDRLRIKEPLWTNFRLMISALILITYVGVEVCLGTLGIPFLTEEQAGAYSLETAGTLMGLYWGGMMLGRMLGSWSLKHISEETFLPLLSLTATILIILAIVIPGPVSGGCLIATGLCLSILFPTIFAIGCRQVKYRRQEAAGILYMGNFGGAILPWIQGTLADQTSLQWSFLLPALATFTVFLYTLWIFRAEKKTQTLQVIGDL